MEPQLPPVGPQMERGPAVNHEQAPSFNAPNLPSQMPEVAPVQSAEHERSMEQSIGDAMGMAVPATAVPVVAPPVPAVQPAQQSDPSTATNPSTASDEDLIEKEWVQKAKQVVQSTKDDPHEQAKQISKLMADYVRKRYGKEVGKAPADV